MPFASASSPPQSWLRGGLAIASGLLLAGLYPPFNLAFFGWIALTPLILAVDGARSRTGFFLGWLSGTVGSLAATGYWIFRAAHDYFQLSQAGAAVFAVAVTQLFVSGYFGLFGLTAALVSGRRLRVLLIPALFVASEYARARLLSGCPWELLGHSQHAVTLVQICDLTGVYGLSFLLALVATAATELRRGYAPALAAGLTVLAVLLYGEWRLDDLAHHTDGSINVALVQGNLPNDRRGRPELFSQQLDHYLNLSLRASTPHPDLIVWPENAVGFFLETNPGLRQRITDLLHSLNAALIVGAPRAGTRPGVAALHNSAYLVTDAGLAAVYDKRKLLPFVERLPLRPQDGPYLPGAEPTVFVVAGVRLGALICYEAIYPTLARELVQVGAQVLVNISNDSWFEAGAGPQQHYGIARFRAVENHVSLVRVTNSGISGAIDPAGRDIAELPPRVARAQSLTIPVATGGSFYSRHGDVFALGCILASVVALAHSRLRQLPQ